VIIIAACVGCSHRNGDIGEEKRFLAMTAIQLSVDVHLHSVEATPHAARVSCRVGTFVVTTYPLQERQPESVCVVINRMKNINVNIN